MSTQFKKQMNELMENLGQCNAHYVRTLKPNDYKRPGVYEADMVKNQVTYLGLARPSSGASASPRATRGARQ